MLNAGSNSSGMGSGAASSSGGSPASKPNTTSNTDYQNYDSNSSPASIHVTAATAVRIILTEICQLTLR